jgi:hypothetical protein
LQADFSASVLTGAVPLAVQFNNTSTDFSHRLQAAKDGFQAYSFAPLEFQKGENREWNFSLSPTFKGMRLVLNWGRNPKDLDAHLRTPAILGTNYQVWYATPYKGHTNSAPFAQLDMDESAGFGPETITIYQLFPGMYHYFVHNFQEEQGDTGPLANSAAVVQIYGDQGLIQTIPVPSEGAGDYWDVCTIDGTTGQINVINRLTATPVSAAMPGLGGAVPNPAPVEPPISSPQYRWEFGDNTTSAEANPAKTYLVPGLYTVSLKVTVPDGRSAERVRTNYITVAQAPASGPQLSIRRLGSAVVLSWRGDGFVLESQAAMGQPVWIPVAPPATLNPDGTYTATIPIQARAYFRLRKGA